MLVEKEVIRPGTYWYRDEATGAPRKLTVTPQLTRYWHEQGNKMLGLGLTVPVPCEHDFSAHPMTPADKLLNNSGWVRGYSLKKVVGKDGKTVEDALFSSVDVTDEEVARKLPSTIRWTSPWINSFTDGNGREWKNVISHLALTTRPRIIEQQAFSGIAAALNPARDANISSRGGGSTGFCLSRAGLLLDSGLPAYPVAFSLWGGAALGTGTQPQGGNPLEDDSDADADGLADDLDLDMPDTDENADGIPDALQDANSDIGMEELLCDLLQALGVPMPDESNEQEFKRHLYEAAMSKIKELTSKGMAGADQTAQCPPDQNQPPTQQKNISHPGKGQNPLINQVQQEQQPMYMSLEEINKLPDPTRGVALAMHAENQRIRAELDANKKVTDGIRAKQLAEANAARNGRVVLLTKLSPRAKSELDAMLANPAMALSMDDRGAVIDPMAGTLSVLEKGLADLPWLLTNDTQALSVQPHPTDADTMSAERAEEIADGLARQMGCAARTS